MKTCYLCRGEVVKKRVNVKRIFDQRMIVIEDVPAEVCIQCGEQYFSPDVVLKMEKIKKAKKFPGEQMLEVPVRHFSQANK